MATTQCIRCGKTRILDKSWTEEVNGATTTYTKMVCPDKECQKTVEEQLKRENDRVRMIQEQSLKRRMNMKSKKAVH